MKDEAPMTNDQTVTQAAFDQAASETERLQRELDITNADHVALWIEANLIPDEPMSQCVSWFACRIVEAYESAVENQRKSFGYLPGNYSIICVDCRKQVDSCAKLSIRCASCADSHRTAHSGEGLDPANLDCLAKREPGEPMFIILGRDPDGGNIVRLWAERRIAAGDADHGRAVLAIADAMDEWGGEPKSAPDPERYPDLPRSAEGRSNGAGEVDPSKMSVEMADLFGLVCKLNRLKTERDDLMRTDGGFSVIERAADMMDEIVDAMPALQSAFNKVCERERLLLAALAQPEAGGDHG